MFVQALPIDKQTQDNKTTRRSTLEHTQEGMIYLWIVQEDTNSIL